MGGGAQVASLLPESVHLSLESDAMRQHFKITNWLYFFLIRNHLVWIQASKEKILLIRLLKQTFFFFHYVCFFLARKQFFDWGAPKFCPKFSNQIVPISQNGSLKTRKKIKQPAHHQSSPDSFKFQLAVPSHPVPSRVKVITSILR